MTVNEAMAILEVDDLLRELEQTRLQFNQDYKRFWLKIVCEAVETVDVNDGN